MAVEGIDEAKVTAQYAAMGGPGTRIFDHPMTRIDTHVFDNDVYMMVSEEDPPVFNNPRREMRLYKGFLSVPFETPVTGVKYRAVTGTARVTVHIFA